MDVEEQLAKLDELCKKLNSAKIVPEVVSWDKREAKLVYHWSTERSSEDVTEQELDELGILCVSVEIEDSCERFWLECQIPGAGRSSSLDYNEDGDWEHS